MHCSMGDNLFMETIKEHGYNNMNKENTKQVIVIRKDLKMRRGKEMSQASHASMAFLTKSGRMNHDIEYGACDYHEYSFINKHSDMEKHYEEIDHWLNHSFRKIVCYVESEQELIDLHEAALAKGLLSHLVEDNGATEFNGVKTKTAIAIGPAYDNMFEGLTDKLTLL